LSSEEDAVLWSKHVYINIYIHTHRAGDRGIVKRMQRCGVNTCI